MTNTTNESEAMEVWRKVFTAWDRAEYTSEADRAAARVIATALEARDAEIALERSLASEQWGHRMAAEVERDEALAAKERAEAALAEEREAHQVFREEVSREVVDYCGYAPADGPSHPITRFILPAKPKPCTCFPGEAPEPCQQKYALTDCLRAAIERAGGVKAVFGDDA